MIYTFYSYKGGVGRTMALANVAELFAREGMKVLMIDWDLEAPGLERFFFPENRVGEIREERGLMDMLLDYKDLMREKLDLSDPENLPFEKPGIVGENTIDVYPDDPNRQLCLMTAGRRSREDPAAYPQTVQQFDWQDFYTHWQGEAYMEWFRHQCEGIADVVLIDSRTGVTEMGGVCTYHLADVVALFCAANDQNIRGTLDMVRNLADESLIQLRRNRVLKSLVVPSRIERDATAQANRFRSKLGTELKKTADDLNAPEISRNAAELERIQIPYIALYAFEEQIAVKNTSGESDFYDPDLTEAYQGLAKELKAYAPKILGYWRHRINAWDSQKNENAGNLTNLKNALLNETRAAEQANTRGLISQLEQENERLTENKEKAGREVQYIKAVQAFST